MSNQKPPGSIEEAFLAWAKEFPQTSREEVKLMGPTDWRPWLKELAQMLGAELDLIHGELAKLQRKRPGRLGGDE